MRYILFTLLLVVFSVKGQITLNSNGTDPLSANSQGTEFAMNYPSKNSKIAALLGRYRSLGKLEKLGKNCAECAANIISWQMPHGGFGLHEIEQYESAWDGKKSRSEWESRGVELGNFDDYATIAEIRYLAAVYEQEENNELRGKIANSIKKALDFTLLSQYPNGGWPQVYPRRKKRVYSNYVTLNDDAMIRIMVLLSDMLAKQPPFDTDLMDQIDKNAFLPALKKALSNLLKAQITTQNISTIWPAQYDPVTFQPMPARSFELASKSTRESVGVLVYLLNWPWQNEQVEHAIRSGLSWFEKNRIANKGYKKGEITDRQGASLWYRFYDVDQDTPLFADRDGIKRERLEQVGDERRTHYSWAGSYANELLKAVNNR